MTDFKFSDEMGLIFCIWLTGWYWPVGVVVGRCHSNCIQPVDGKHPKYLIAVISSSNFMQNSEWVEESEVIISGGGDWDQLYLISPSEVRISGKRRGWAGLGTFLEFQSWSKSPKFSACGQFCCLLGSRACENQTNNRYITAGGRNKS